MENSALNVAHQHYRRAEAHVQYKRFDEAIACHKNAAEKLDEAKKLTSVAKALESITLQQDFHNRQEDIIRLKKIQFEMYKKAMENQRQKMLEIARKAEVIGTTCRGVETSNLQDAIFRVGLMEDGIQFGARIKRTMEEADSLLQILVKQGIETENEDGDYLKSDTTNGVVTAAVEWTKKPKSDNTVIEELRVVNHQLRQLIEELLIQLDASCQEANELRERVRILEAHQATNTTERLDLMPGNRKTSLHVITDSTGGNSSPFVLSPCSELSPDIPETLVPRVLPTLAPLEMPNFDFSMFVKQQSEGES